MEDDNADNHLENSDRTKLVYQSLRYFINIFSFLFFLTRDLEVELFGIYDAEKMLVVFRGDDVRGYFVGINGTAKAKGARNFNKRNNCQIYVWERDG